MNKYHVYIIAYEQSRQVQYYTGYTSHPRRRWKEHLQGRGARCLRGRKILGANIIFTYNDASSAIMMENHVKSLSHEQKARLYANQVEPL